MNEQELAEFEELYFAPYPPDDDDDEETSEYDSGIEYDDEDLDATTD